MDAFCEWAASHPRRLAILIAICILFTGAVEGGALNGFLGG